MIPNREGARRKAAGYLQPVVWVYGNLSKPARWPHRAGAPGRGEFSHLFYYRQIALFSLEIFSKYGNQDGRFSRFVLLDRLF
jgi:hypothetical protein